MATSKKGGYIILDFDGLDITSNDDVSKAWTLDFNCYRMLKNSVGKTIKVFGLTCDEIGNEQVMIAENVNYNDMDSIEFSIRSVVGSGYLIHVTKENQIYWTSI